MKKILETERLALYEFGVNDAEFILKLVNSEGWLHFIGDRNIHSVDDAKLYLLNEIMKAYQELGFGFWRIQLKDSHTTIGMCGLTKRLYLNDPDIGYALLPEFTGRGYAQEAVAATLQYAHQSLYLKRILAITKPDNVRSVKLLQKLGVNFEQMMVLPVHANAMQLMAINFDR